MPALSLWRRLFRRRRTLRGSAAAFGFPPWAAGSRGPPEISKYLVVGVADRPGHARRPISAGSEGPPEEVLAPGPPFGLEGENGNGGTSGNSRRR